MKIFLVLLVSVLVIYLGQVLIKKARGATAAGKIESYGRTCEILVYDALRSRLPRKNVFRNLTFPVVKNGETLWTETDVVCVTRGGVIVCEVKGMKGAIDDPETGDWTQTRRDKSLTFQNPYEQNNGHVTAVKRALASAGIKRVRIYNVVVYTDKNVKFTHRHNWLMRSDNFVEFAARLDDKALLKSKTVKAVDEALAQYKKKHKPTAALRHTR